MTAGRRRPIAEYDVPPDAWYFAADRQPAMPFAVLLEVRLAAVRLAGGLHRLGPDQRGRPVIPQPRRHGRRQQLPVGPDAGTLTHDRHAHEGLDIRRHDHPALSISRCAYRRRRSVYRGDTYFGFFSAAALAQQVGIREASAVSRRQPKNSRRRGFAYPTERAVSRIDVLRMVDRIDLYAARRRTARPGLHPGSEAGRSGRVVLQGPLPPGPGLARARSGWNRSCNCCKSLAVRALGRRRRRSLRMRPGAHRRTAGFTAARSSPANQSRDGSGRSHYNVTTTGTPI